MFWTIVFAILFVMYWIPLILGALSLLRAGICWLFSTKEWWTTIGVVASVFVLISIFA